MSEKKQYPDDWIVQCEDCGNLPSTCTCLKAPAPEPLSESYLDHVENSVNDADYIGIRSKGVRQLLAEVRRLRAEVNDLHIELADTRADRVTEVCEWKDKNAALRAALEKSRQKMQGQIPVGDNLSDWDKGYASGLELSLTILWDTFYTLKGGD